MRINQLRDYLDALIASGIDPNTLVCIHDSDPALCPMEVVDSVMLKGVFREDPSPKMCGPLTSTGTFLLLQTFIDYDQVLNTRPAAYELIDVAVEPPEKSWPNGHWSTEPTRKPGQL